TGAEAFAYSIEKGGMTYYRARFAGLDKERAEAACKYLKRNDVECVIVYQVASAAQEGIPAPRGYKVVSAKPVRAWRAIRASPSAWPARSGLFGGGSDEEEDGETAAPPAGAGADALDLKAHGLSSRFYFNSWTPAVALRHVANLAVAARK